MYAAARGTGRSSLQRRPREPVLQALISARICWRSQKEKLKTMLTLPSSRGMQWTSFEDDSFNFVTIGFGLRNLPDYRQAIEEFYRVLTPGGVLVVLETSTPENSIVNRGFDLYFGKVMPKIGGVIAGRTKEYEWLYESTSTFLTKPELKDMMSSTGFANIKILSHTLGTAATHIGYKPLGRVGSV